MTKKIANVFSILKNIHNFAPLKTHGKCFRIVLNGDSEKTDPTAPAVARRRQKNDPKSPALCDIRNRLHAFLLIIRKMKAPPSGAAGGGKLQNDNELTVCPLSCRHRRIPMETCRTYRFHSVIPHTSAQEKRKLFVVPSEVGGFRMYHTESSASGPLRSTPDPFTLHR